MNASPHQFEFTAAFGRNLARARQDHGWTLRQAALKAGVSWMTVRRAELGADIAVSRAAALAAAYGVTLDALLGGEPAACRETPHDPSPRDRGDR